MVRRRNFLMLSGAALVPVGAATVGAVHSRAAVPAAAEAPAPRADVAPSEPFAHALPIPPLLEPTSSSGAADRYDIRMQEADTEIVKGLTSRVRTYAGSFAAPMIRATSGREVVVTQTNGLSVNAAVHLHGGKVLSEHDGLPMDVIAPGASRTYHYPNDQRAASLWFHDHAHHLEAENVYLGLHGLYLLSDPEEQALGLPSGAYDLPLVIRDARVEVDGTLTYTRPSDCPHMLVNGKERPYVKVAARKYRVRLYNACANRHLRLRLADGGEFTQIGTDGGLLPEPIQRTEFLMSGGERVDLVMDFSRYSVGDSLVLENTVALDTERPEVIRFDVDREAEDTSRVPARLAASLPAVPRAAVQREFELRTFPEMTINGKLYDPNRVDVETTVGSSEEWTVYNAEAPVDPPDFHVWHSFHTHLVSFRVLERNGKPVGPEDSGWKDTVTVPPSESVKIAMTWGPHAGEYLYHCHQLGHSMDGQMGRIDLVEP